MTTEPRSVTSGARGPGRARTRAGATRVATLALGAGAAGALGLALTARTVALVSTDGVAQVDELVEGAVTGVGALVAAWLAASALLATVCLAVRAAGATWHAGERAVHRFAPAVVRRTVAVVVAAGLGATMATGAQAAATPAPGAAAAVAAPAQVVDLGWVVTQTAPPSAPAPRTDAEPTGRTMPTAAHATVVVQPGDSLWRIAAEHANVPHPTAADVAASWPHWYAANRDTVGADPGLIVPGQVLVAPDEADR